jgi:hypothetical protein
MFATPLQEKKSFDRLPVYRSGRDVVKFGFEIFVTGKLNHFGVANELLQTLQIVSFALYGFLLSFGAGYRHSGFQYWQHQQHWQPPGGDAHATG